MESYFISSESLALFQDLCGNVDLDLVKAQTLFFFNTDISNAIGSLAELPISLELNQIR